jgi:hypothetical protein
MVKIILTVFIDDHLKFKKSVLIKSYNIVLLVTRLLKYAI